MNTPADQISTWIHGGQPPSGFAEVRTCPKCGGNIVSKGAIGTDRFSQEQESDWEECEACGQPE